MLACGLHIGDVSIMSAFNLGKRLTVEIVVENSSKPYLAMKIERSLKPGN